MWYMKQAISNPYTFLIFQVHYQGTITYVRCQDAGDIPEPPILWSGSDSWKSLSGQMDMFCVPASHFQLRDQPYAELCGSLMMTTALIHHLTRYSKLQQQVPRSRSEERRIEWIKQAIEISMYSGKG